MMRIFGRVALCVALLGLVAGVGYSQWLVTGDREKAADLIAGGGNIKGAKDVGDIYIWKDADTLYVEFDLIPAGPTDPWEQWYLTETHVAIALNPADFPQAQGNPIPGKFKYKQEHDFASGYIVEIPLNGITGQFYVAAQAVVCQLGNLEGFEIALPSTLELKVTHDPNVVFSYFPTVEIRNGEWLNGTHPNGWCIDLDHTIVPNTWYWADVYSVYGTIPAGIVAKAENLGAVNWLLNQEFVGKPYLGGGNFTGKEVQYAIWRLLNNEPITDYPNLPNWVVDYDRVQWLYEQALDNAGYIPECGEMVGIVLVPYSATGQRLQALIIRWPLPCGDCDTAWAAIYDGLSLNYPFSGKNWATYLWLTL
jgi:hypothetical protein